MYIYMYIYMYVYMYISPFLLHINPILLIKTLTTIKTHACSYEGLLTHQTLSAQDA